MLVLLGRYDFTRQNQPLLCAKHHLLVDDHSQLYKRLQIWPFALLTKDFIINALSDEILFLVFDV